MIRSNVEPHRGLAFGPAPGVWKNGTAGRHRRGVGVNDRRLTRRQVFGAAGALGVVGVLGVLHRPCPAGPARDICRGDLVIDASTAVLDCAEAPLTPAEGLRDARAVWVHVPAGPERRVLIFLHGHNGYVTVDAAGRSRVPDWAARDEAARKGASAKPAAPLVYGLDRLGSRLAGTEPIVMVPEVSTLATGAFWAKEPAGQYADPARLGNLLADGLAHLACLRRPDGRPYLPEGFANRRTGASRRSPARGPDQPSSASTSAAIPARACRWKRPPDRL